YLADMKVRVPFDEYSRIRVPLMRRQHPFLLVDSPLDVLLKELEHYGLLTAQVIDIAAEYSGRYQRLNIELADEMAKWSSPRLESQLAEYRTKRRLQVGDGPQMGTYWPYDELWYERMRLVREGCRAVGRAVDAAPSELPP